MTKLLLTFLAAAAMGTAPAWAQTLEVLIEVDLSVENQLTLRSTTGNSAATVTGSDFTGVYLDSFYAGPGEDFSIVIGSGDLVPTLNTSDGSPSLFRANAGTDPGLNFWSLANEGDLSFTAGVQAFTGTATYVLDPASYADMLAAAASGVLRFPADDEPDIPSSTIIGRWVRLGAEPPEPPGPVEPIPTLSDLGLLLMLLAMSLVAARTLRHS